MQNPGSLQEATVKSKNPSQGDLLLEESMALEKGPWKELWLCLRNSSIVGIMYTYVFLHQNKFLNTYLISNDHCICI